MNGPEKQGAAATRLAAPDDSIVFKHFPHL